MKFFFSNLSNIVYLDGSLNHESNKNKICLADCATMRAILKKREYFSNLNLAEANV
ncbi:hypothetical protein Syun_006243 [Stephania yunnanensis]|uniref:Uncharacterized protein n=1 Tax=Stephania yunnanensis TaxID=152371 RepID=A0AAP0KXW7_9MAGN